MWCINSNCPTNPPNTPPPGFNGLLGDEESEKRSKFIPRILLCCGHSICITCVNEIISKGASFHTCRKCEVPTNFGPSVKYAASQSSMPINTEILQLNQNSPDEAHYHAFSIGKAFDMGQVSVNVIEEITLDENTEPIRPPSAYIDDIEISRVQSRIGTLPEIMRPKVLEAVETYKKYGRYVKALHKSKTDMNKTVYNAKMIVRSHFDWLHGLLQIKEDKMMKDVLKKYHNFVEQFDKKEEAIAKTRSALEKTLKSSELKNPQLLSNDDKLKQIEHNLRKYIQSFNIGLHSNFPEQFKIKPMSNRSEVIDYIDKAVFWPTRSTEITSIFADQRPSQPRAHPTASLNLRPLNSNHSQARLYEHTSERIVRLNSVKSPHQIILTISGKNKDYQNFVNEITKLCLEKFYHSPNPEDLKTGMKCFVYSKSLQLWCRGKVKDLSEDMDKSPLISKIWPIPSLLNKSIKFITVYLCDFGKEEKVNIINVRENRSSLWRKYPYFLLSVRLNHIRPLGNQKEWNDADLKQIKNRIHKFFANSELKLLEQRRVQNQAAEEVIIGDVIQFEHEDITTPVPTLCEYLFYSKLVDHDNSPNQIYQREIMKSIPKYEISKVQDSTQTVEIKHIRHPGSFFVVLGGEVEPLDKFEKELNQTYQEKVKPTLHAYIFYAPKLKSPCAVRLTPEVSGKTSDNVEFKRGEILSLKPPDEVEVLLVDSGEIKTMATKNCLLLQDKFITKPRAALECYLHGIKPYESLQWSNNAVKFFKELLEGCPGSSTDINVKYKSSSKVGVVLRNLNCSDMYSSPIVNEILVDQSYAKYSERTEQALPLNDPRARLSTDDEPMEISEPEFVHNAYHILKEIFLQIKEFNLKGTDTLIPVKLTTDAGVPSSFLIQIKTPWIDLYLNKFMDNIVKEYSAIYDENLRSFESGEICVYKNKRTNSWQRGRVEKRIKDDICEEISIISDPRTIKTDSRSTNYSLLDMEYGTIECVERQNMRKAKNDLQNCGEFFIACHIDGIEEGDASSFQFFQRTTRNYMSNLFIKLDDLPDQQPLTLAVNLLYSVSASRNGISAEHTKYVSIRKELVQRNMAKPKGNINVLVDTDEIEAHIADNYIDLRHEISYKRNCTKTISKLKSDYYSSEAIPEINFYSQPEPPQSREFYASVTNYQDDLKIWFRRNNKVIQDDSTEYGLVCKTIFRELIDRETLPQFEVLPGKDRPCLAFSSIQKRWFRGIIKNIKNLKYVVQDVDTGYVEEIFKEQLSPLVTNDNIPKLAMSATLPKVAIYSDTKEIRDKIRAYFCQEVLNKNCHFNWENYPSSDMQVSIRVNDVYDLRQQLMTRDLIKEAMTQKMPDEVTKRLSVVSESLFTPSNYQLSLRKDYSVLIPHYIDDNYFYIHLNTFDRPISEDERDIVNRHLRFESMTERVKSEASNFPPAWMYKRGDLVAAEYVDDDNQYYRGVIIGPTRASRYELLFVDYGNIEIVEHERIKKLPDGDFSLCPIHAIMVKVENIYPSSGAWTESICLTMRSVFDEWMRSPSPPRFLVRLKHKDPHSQVYHVDMYEQDQVGNKRPLFNQLIEQRILRQTRP